jgi:hypothetical protein
MWVERWVTGVGVIVVVSRGVEKVDESGGSGLR